MALEGEIHKRLMGATYRATRAVVTPAFVEEHLTPLLVEPMFPDGYPYGTRTRISIDKAVEIAAPLGWKVQGIIGEMLKPSSPVFWQTILDAAPQNEVITMAQAIRQLEIEHVARSGNLNLQFEDTTLTEEALVQAKRELPGIVSENNSGFYGLSLQYFALAALFGSRFKEIIPLRGGQTAVPHEKTDLLLRGLVTDADYTPVPIFEAANEAAQDFGGMAVNFDEFYDRLKQLFPTNTERSVTSAYAYLIKHNAFQGPDRNCPAKDPVSVMLFEGFGAILTNQQTNLQHVWQPRIYRR